MINGNILSAGYYSHLQTFAITRRALWSLVVCVFRIVCLELKVFPILLQFDGVQIVSGSLDTSIRVWNADTGQCIHTLTGTCFES